MGRDIDRTEFSDEDHRRYRERLDRSLAALELVLARPGFGVGPMTLGAELEVFLVDGAGRPLPVNQKVLEAAVDPRLTYELARFNLEFNTDFHPLAGHPLTALGDELRIILRAAQEAARRCRAEIAIIGILPTLRPPDLGPGALTDTGRYRALSSTLRKRRGQPFRVAIDGPEPLTAACDDLTYEGANTSLQLHLRVDPAEFDALYNAVQLATAPVLAVAGNSPCFLGHLLWEETRIALFKQAVDARPWRGARRASPGRVTFGREWLHGGGLGYFREVVRTHEPLLPVLTDLDPVLCAERGDLPSLAELRLHAGTVWRWNRAIYDPTEGGHLRIEMRALPAGPTVVDMMANAAFLLGLALGLAAEGVPATESFPFSIAHTNFYRAAQFGLDAKLRWPRQDGSGATSLPAAALIPRLLPLAARGLQRAGIAPGEARSLLQVIGERCRSGQTGAVWQKQAVLDLEGSLGREEALREMLARYRVRAEEGKPVHRWAVP